MNEPLEGTAADPRSPEAGELVQALSHDPHERSLLQCLDVVLSVEEVRVRMQPIVQRVEERLARDPASSMAWEPVPINLYGASLPLCIQSSRPDAIEAGRTHQRRYLAADKPGSP